ncbi:helix-turn-helix domain-containing protein [Streptomyces fungicidicus]|uniref:helix-turn-helix domain-containing protein n=1 Tax=Streptomyces fungicidicus TaxID=68203 RepID=UPI003316F843
METNEYSWAGEEGYRPEVHQRREVLKGMLSLSNEELGDIFRRGLEFVADDGPVMTPLIGGDKVRVALLTEPQLAAMTARTVDYALTDVLADSELTHATRVLWAHLRNVPNGQRKATISRALGMDKKAVSRSINALAERGLVVADDGVWTVAASTGRRVW